MPHNPRLHPIPPPRRWADFWIMNYTKDVMQRVWKFGEQAVLRGIVSRRGWSARSVIEVKDELARMGVPFE